MESSLIPTKFSSREIPPNQEDSGGEEEIEMESIASRSKILQCRYAQLQKVDYLMTQRNFLMPHNDNLVLIKKFNIDITPKKLSCF